MSLFGDDDIIYDDEMDDDAPSVDADRLVEPKAMSYCLGHNEQERLFLELYEKNSLPHAMIFAGMQGIGKTTMAFRLAKFLLKHGTGHENQDSLFGGDALPQDLYTLDVATDDPVFTRMISGGHADLLHIERIFDASKGKRDKNLKVEQLRKIEPFLRRTSSEGGWRIVIIEDADTMNRSAQNAILKILEEPPANVLIVLIAHRPGMLIPTIRSRARMLSFSPLSPDHMGELLNKQGHSLSIQDLELLAAISEGSIGQALRYAEEGGIVMFHKLTDHLAHAPNWRWNEILELSKTMSGTAQDKEYRMFVDLFQWVFRQMLFFKARGHEDAPSYLSGNVLRSLMDKYSLVKLIEITDNLKNHFERIDFSNLDRRDAVRGAFLMLND